MTDERKAAVKKATNTYLAAQLTTIPERAIAAALDSVGYFALVDVAEAAKWFLKGCFTCNTMSTEDALERLRAALAKVQP